MKKFLFRNVKMFVVSIMSLALILSFSLPALAAENNTEALFNEMMDAMSQQHILTKEEFGNLKLDGSASVLDTSAFYDTLNSLDMSAFGRLDYEIPSSIHSQNLLTAQYTALHENLSSMGYGYGFALQIPEMDMGYSKDIQSTFKSVYGDLSYKYDSDVSLPEGWDMASLMEAAITKRDEYAGDIKDSDAYKVVSDAISANKTVTQAITTLETPELKSAITLQEMLDASTGDIANKWAAENNAGHAAIKEVYRANSEQYGEDFQALYDEAVGNAAAWLELNRMDPSEQALFDINPFLLDLF